MFGIIFGIVDLIGNTIFSINLEKSKQENRRRAIANGFDTYYDNRGGEWYIKQNGNDIKCDRRKNLNNGHNILSDASDHNIILKDYTKENELNEEKEFCRIYNEANDYARRNGKLFFYVGGLNSLDKRCGHYELNTEKYYELSKDSTYYFKHYYDTTKSTKKYLGSKRITEDEFLKYGGHTAVPYKRKR
jgi:hypothetical protein